MALKLHLTANRYAIRVQEVLLPRASEKRAFRRDNAEAETVPTDWTAGAKRLGPQRVEAAPSMIGDVGGGAWGRVQRGVLETNERDDGATAGDIR
jgi:hypothetical protein